MGETTLRARVPRPRPTTNLEALPETDWSQLRRVCLPGRPDVLIDHVLIGPCGIHVIRYLPFEPDGPAAMTGCERQCLCDVGAAVCAKYADAVSGLLPPRYRDRVRPVLCLRGDDERAEEIGDVLVATLGTFEHIVRSSPSVLSTLEVAQGYSSLRAALEQVPLAPGTSPQRFGVALRVAAASVAVAASIGVLVFGPEVIELFGTRR